MFRLSSLCFILLLSSCCALDPVAPPASEPAPVLVPETDPACDRENVDVAAPASQEPVVISYHAYPDGIWFLVAFALLGIGVAVRKIGKPCPKCVAEDASNQDVKPPEPQS